MTIECENFLNAVFENVRATRHAIASDGHILPVRVDFDSRGIISTASLRQTTEQPDMNSFSAGGKFGVGIQATHDVFGLFVDMKTIVVP